jgi:tetratricopeptide (TPR) repeat protein
MRSIIALLFLLFITPTVILPPDEYLKGLIEVSNTTTDNQQEVYSIARTVSQTLFRRYPDLYIQSPDLLLEVYNELFIGEIPFTDRRTWNRTIIHAYLRENNVNLGETDVIRFANYHIAVAPHDFNGDGSSEYVLDVSKGEKIQDRDSCVGIEYLDYLVVQQNGDDYTFIDTPLRPLGGGWYEPGIKELFVEDLNADGLPEWVLAYGGVAGGGPAMGYVSFGMLYILGWRNSGLASLSPDYQPGLYDEKLAYTETAGGGCPTLSYSVEWEFENLDDDKPIEILQHQVFQDNWLCETLFTKRFDWDGNQYAFTTSSRAPLIDTQNCEQRKGEEAMWQEDYAAAITHFERALQLPQYTPSQTSQEYYADDLVSLNQYLRIRLALAYILTGQSAKAQPLLETLVAETYTEDALREFASVLTEALDSSQKACFASFEVFTRAYPRIILGTVIEIDTDPRNYYPERIGCNAPSIVETILAENQFTDNPIAALEALELSVKKSLVEDFNQDGRDEVLVWLDLPVDPIFFAHDGEVYRVSRPLVDPYLRAEATTTWLLPDDAGLGLIYTSSDPQFFYLEQPPWLLVYDRMGGGMGGYNEFCIPTGQDYVFVRLWRMERDELKAIFQDEVCQDDLSKLFPEGEPSRILDGGQLKIEDANTIIRDLRYVWDSETRSYLPSPIPTAYSSPVPTIEPEYSSVDAALRAEDYEAVVEMTEAEINQVQLPEYLDSLQYNRYLQAFALQMLGRDNEAATVYQLMLSAAPDSMWAKLAALQLKTE